MSDHVWRRLGAWAKAGKNRSLILGMTVGVFVLGVGVMIMDFTHSVTALEGGIQRNTYGEGSKTEELEVSVDNGKKRNMQVEISEQSYTSKELQDVFRRCTLRLEKIILGANESFDRIESDMDLITKMPEEPIEVSWELDRYDVMNIYGELQREKLETEGTLVNLKAVLTYEGNRKEQALYECTVMVYPAAKTKAEEQVSKLQAAIQNADKKTQTSKELNLPEKLEGTSVSYYPRMQERGIVLMVMAILVGILLCALEKQKEDQEKQKKRQQMLIDYPEIINKLTLFLGAGMTVKRAWRKMIQDYEEQKEIWGIRYAYEEMKKACHEMDSGITETESYERFGRRCNIQEYVRLGALLSQNLRRGTKGLNQMLKLEAIQAFEERKARAKKMGEEAGTKLLGPMFLMLAVVLVLVIVPAFLSVGV